MARKGLPDATAQMIMLQDAVECYMIRGDFLPELRADDHKRFFDLRDVEPCTAKAIEQNFDFVVEIVATLAAEPVWMAHAGWKAVFRKLADRYAVFPAKTKKKVVADWASVTSGNARSLCLHAMTLASRSGGARSPKIVEVKRCIHLALQQASPAGDIEQLLRERVSTITNQELDDLTLSSSSGDDHMKADKAASGSEPRVPLVDAEEGQEEPNKKVQEADVNETSQSSGRQAVKEKQPLLPSGIKLDGSLEDQVESLSQTLASAVGDDDLVAAQQKVRAAAKARKRAKGDDDEGSGDDDDLDSAEPATKKPRGKGKAKTKVTNGKSKAKHTAKKADKKEIPSTGDAKGEGHAKAAESTKGEGDDEPEETGAPEPAVENPPSEKTPVDLKLWKEKEPVLRLAGIPMAEGFEPKAKSFTINRGEGTSSIGVLWMVDQLYVSDMKSELAGFRVNKKNGVTVSVRKHKGWCEAFGKAMHLAGWCALPHAGA